MSDFIERIARKIDEQQQQKYPDSEYAAVSYDDTPEEYKEALADAVQVVIDELRDPEVRRGVGLDD